jgi:DNA-binding NtrC family response regulator
MTEQPSAAKQRHLLIVDDNLDLAQTYQELFEAHGYRVNIAANGFLALNFLLERGADAVLCDLTMPQLEGDAFYAAVQQVKPEMTGRFIFVTGHSGNPKFEAFIKKVTCPVLYKPVSVDKLLEALDHLFSRVE